MTLLSPEENVQCFTYDFMSCIPDDARIVKFVDYMHDTHMKDGARFPSHLWAAMEPVDRTSNAYEAFHSKLSTYFYHTHPDVTTFVVALKNIKNHTAIRKNTAETNSHSATPSAAIPRNVET